MVAIRLCIAILLSYIAVCFATPALTTVTPSSIPTSGSLIQIAGTGFNTITTINWVRISGLACTTVVKVSDVLITCTAPAGLGQGNKLELNYDANLLIFTTCNYEAAGGAYGCNKGPIQVQTGVAYTVTVCGSNFGTEDASKATGYTGVFRALVGQAPVTLFYEHNNDYFTFDVPQTGIGANQKVTLYFGTQKVIVSDLDINYPPPAVSGVEVDTSKKRAAGIKLIISGRGFGIPSPFISITVSMGGTPCVGVKHVSDGELRCTLMGGSGSNAAIIVSVNGMSNANPAAGAGAPAIKFDFPDPTPPAGIFCTRPYGASDFYNPAVCNCWSGNAPTSSLTGTDCDLHAVCPGRVTTANVVAQFAPTRPKTEFRNDRLFIKQTVPIVKNRRDLNIQFVAPSLTGATSPSVAAGTQGSDACFYPGTLWEKRLNELDCFDEYYASIPWSQNEFCGFVEDKDTAVVPPTVRLFKANLVTTYSETFKKSDGKMTSRKISSAYLLVISFAKQIKALTTTITTSIPDENAASTLDVLVDGDALYDVATKNTIITFQTSIVWPYKLPLIDHIGDWNVASDNNEVNPISAIAKISATQPGDLDCDAVADTVCEQQWRLVIDTEPNAPTNPQVCNLKGTIKFNTGRLLCRDNSTVAGGSPCIGTPNTNYTISIGKTELCDNADDIDATKGLEATMEPFYDEDLSLSQSIFKTGDMAYFKIVVTDPTSTIDQITFRDITLKDPSPGSTTVDKLYEQTNPGDPATPATSAIWEADANFNITQEVRGMMLSPKTSGELSFHVRLMRQHLNVVNTLSTLTTSSATQQITVEVTLDILYHGNQRKRSVITASTVPAVAHAQIAFYDMVNEDELEPHHNEESVDDFDGFNMLFSSATTVAASSLFGVVAIAALVLA